MSYHFPNLSADKGTPVRLEGRAGSPAHLHLKQALALADHRPDRPPSTFRYAPILRTEAPQARDTESERRTLRTATANALYILRQPGEDEFGAVPDVSAKARHLVASGRSAPIQGPTADLAELGLWEAADAAARIDTLHGPSAFHAVGWLPRDGDVHSWTTAVLTWSELVLAANGIISDWAIHATGDDPALNGFVWPHVHWIGTLRTWRRKRDPGRLHTRWFRKASDIAAARAEWERIAGVRPQANHRRVGA